MIHTNYLVQSLDCDIRVPHYSLATLYVGLSGEQREESVAQPVTKHLPMHLACTFD